MDTATLRGRLAYQPQELRFGTSGRRGEVAHLQPLEIYINALAELRYLLTLRAEEGGIRAGAEFPFGYDLRPSSPEIARAVVRAIRDAGLTPVNLGQVPTPAVMLYAVSRGLGSIMVTGSHIPFDRNGYKLNTSAGELLKHHEQPINEAVARLRKEVYDGPFEASLFNDRGELKQAPELPVERSDARREYMDRYVSFFGTEALKGARLLVYQHSAVGRDLLVELLRELGAEVTPAGRSETFVPIDTENVDDSLLATVQALVDAQPGTFDAVVSTDGDSDRPLILGAGESRKIAFYGGDLVGMVVAEHLGADGVVVPITCNDAIDGSSLSGVLLPRTRIGSPHVIAGMQQAVREGRRRVCGWEANGGFLLGGDIQRNGRTLKALATRDAVLPIVAVLAAAKGRGATLEQVFSALPARFGRAALLKQFPRPVALRIVERLTPAGPEDRERVLAELARHFAEFGPIAGLDYTDGVRIQFASGEVAHLRPSGNADEFRFYAVADSPERADQMVRAGVAEPDGILRRLERAMGGGSTRAV